MTSSSMLEAGEVGRRAAEILYKMQAHLVYGRLQSSSTKYSTCWATFTGYPAISRWSLERDAAPLLDEALRVLALKAAVFDFSTSRTSSRLARTPGRPVPTALSTPPAAGRAP
ncbi:hypothetical protein ACLQ29_34875 [Micromonospora sp. DT228]|uniref:hypothetical protein n=1 Tax=Micromonospora sp. DT228 TaxID=3393443 RepID=UPI003CEABF38